jgi:hypothetical protein
MSNTETNEVVVDKNRIVAKARVKTQWRNGAKKGEPEADKWACDIVYIDEKGLPAVRDAWVKNRKDEPKIELGSIIYVEFYTGSDGDRYCEVLDVTGL